MIGDIMAKGKQILLGLGAALGLGALFAGKSEAATRTPGKDDGRAILVIGDSHAVGLQNALKALYPGRTIYATAVGGTSSPQMKTAPDEPYYIIVSTGTNDLNGQAASQKIADNIRRVLGPYVTNSAQKGILLYMLPPLNMVGEKWATLRKRAAEIRPLLALSENARFLFADLGAGQPLSSDGIHYTPAGYTAMAKAAMAMLPNDVSQPVISSGGSKSGLLPNGQMDPAFQKRAFEIADEMGIPRDYFLAVMYFETGGSFRSDIKNAAGSGATGLIQWMPQYAPSVTGGKTVDDLARMSALEQLEYVRMYFKRFGSFAGRDPADAYLAVFTPAMMGKPDQQAFYASGTTAYAQNAGLDTDKDGKITVGEVRATIKGAVGKVRAKGWA